MRQSLATLWLSCGHRTLTVRPPHSVSRRVHMRSRLKCPRRLRCAHGSSLIPAKQSRSRKREPRPARSQERAERPAPPCLVVFLSAGAPPGNNSPRPPGWSAARAPLPSFARSPRRLFPLRRVQPCLRGCASLPARDLRVQINVPPFWVTALASDDVRKLAKKSLRESLHAPPALGPGSPIEGDEHDTKGHGIQAPLQADQPRVVLAREESREEVFHHCVREVNLQ